MSSVELHMHVGYVSHTPHHTHYNITTRHYHTRRAFWQPLSCEESLSLSSRSSPASPGPT